MKRSHAEVVPVGAVKKKTNENAMNLFKEEFKKFKDKKTDFQSLGVIDFDLASDHELPHQPTDGTSGRASALGLHCPSQWKIYKSLKQGAIFIRNPFTAKGERDWIKRCLRDYPLKGNKTNLDCHYELNEDDNLWQLRKSNDPIKRELIEKLRWTTLGYHHNWDTKIYSMNDSSPFPEELSQLCCFITEICSYKKYNPEAAIVNYYHMDSTIGGHTDHSEFDHTSPLISISFGQSAVFLLGGTTKDERPKAMYLHSGDIIIMSNKCRLDYHAVPRVFPAPKATWMDFIEPEEDFNDFNEYLSHSRININVRQVFESKDS